MDVGSVTGAEGSGRVKVAKIAKYCHQCHRIAKGVVVSCKARKGNKFCSVRYCQKCLQNRYKQTAEVVALDGCWRCPKCEGICNCCICRKKNVPISSGEAFMGCSDGALLGKNSAGFLDAVPKDAGTENHVIALSNDEEKKRERVEQGECSMQDGTHCIPVTKVMGVLFALNKILFESDDEPLGGGTDQGAGKRADATAADKSTGNVDEAEEGGAEGEDTDRLSDFGEEED